MSTARKARVLLILGVLLIGVAGVASEVGLGGFAHFWGEYRSDGFGFLNRFSFTTGPSITFDTGLISCDVWFGTDPIQNGWIGEQPDPIASGEVRVSLNEVGGRISSSSSPLFLSASYSRLQCRVDPVECHKDHVAGGWDAYQLTGGGGMRLGPLWAVVEGGLRWWDWIDVPEMGEVIETGITISGGFTIPVNGVSPTETRYRVESLPVALEESFPITCNDWEWEGQAGRITTLEEQLSIQVRESGQRVMQRFCCDEARFVLDVDVSPFSSYNEDHYFGIVLRYAGDDDFYAFDVRADGNVRFLRVVEGVRETIVAWRRTTAYEPGETNHVRVVAPGNQFILYLNDRRVLVVPEVSFLKGDVGVYAGTHREPGTWISFDNLTVRSIAPNTLLDPRSMRTREIELVERLGIAMLAGAGAYISLDQNLDAIGYTLIGTALYALFSDSSHLLIVD